MGPQILQKFYSCTIESTLTGCITIWYGKRYRSAKPRTLNSFHLQAIRLLNN